MKFLFVFIVALLLVINANAQITVVGDTLDLKNTKGSGIILLLHYDGNTDNGGGLFIRADSAYVENGTNAFDYPYDGYQWVRLNLTDQYVRPASTNYQGLLWVTDHYTPYTIAGIDSFTTTDVVDTIAISGVDTADVFVFNEYTPNYSSAIDSVTYSYQCKADTCFVTRTSSSGDASPAYKSGGQYSYIRIKK